MTINRHKSHVALRDSRLRATALAQPGLNVIAEKAAESSTPASMNLSQRSQWQIPQSL
jgi:hypothetical protein